LIVDVGYRAIGDDRLAGAAPIQITLERMLSILSTARTGLMALCLVGAIAGEPLRSADSEIVKLRVGRSLQLRARADIYRTAIVNPAVCDVAQFAPRELSIAGRGVGQTQVTFWFNDPSIEPLTWVIDVQ
jgi:Flp pilus assembly secretin CpaC